MNVQRFMQQFERFNVFGNVSMDLRCISTNDIVPDETRDHLAQASERGRLLYSLVISSKTAFYIETSLCIHHCNKSKTFASLTEVTM